MNDPSTEMPGDRDTARERDEAAYEAAEWNGELQEDSE